MTPPQLELLFIHTPKTGGSSVKAALEAHYGETLFQDYSDGPADPSAECNIDPEGYRERHAASGRPWLAGKAAVIGHAWPRKYDGVTTRVRATVLREPIARAVSLHRFWSAGRFSPLRDNPVRRHLMEQRLDFMAFARLPAVNTFYTQAIFRDVDMASFDFIGDQAQVSHDWAGTMARLGVSAAEIRVNETREFDADYASTRAGILDDAVRMGRLRDLFARDIAFYEQWAGQ